MAKPWPLVLLLTACASAPPPPRPVTAAPSPGPSPDLTITEAAVGRLDGKTRTTLEGLRTALRGYEVRPVYDGGLEYHIYKDGEHLYYVIPTTGAGDKLFNIHIVSGRFTVATHPWRAGQPFKGAVKLTHCECWGDQPVCYAAGEHIAVAFKRACEGLSDGDERARVVLDGVAVQRMIWSPSPFGVAGPDAAADEGVEGGVAGD